LFFNNSSFIQYTVSVKTFEAYRLWTDKLVNKNTLERKENEKVDFKASTTNQIRDIILCCRFNVLL